MRIAQDCPVDGGRSPQTLWRHRTGRALADPRTGGAGTSTSRCSPAANSHTSAKLDATCRRRCASTARCAIPTRCHMVMLERVDRNARDEEIRLPAFHLELYYRSRLFSPSADPVSDDPARPLDLPEHQPVVHDFQNAGYFDLERASAGRVPQANWVTPIIMALPENLLTPATDAEDYSRVLGPHRHRKYRRRSPHQDRMPLRDSAEDREQRSVAPTRLLR